MNDYDTEEGNRELVLESSALSGVLHQTGFSWTKSLMQIDHCRHRCHICDLFSAIEMFANVVCVTSLLYAVGAFTKMFHGGTFGLADVLHATGVSNPTIYSFYNTVYLGFGKWV